MKWIVKSDFYRTRALKGVKIVGACEGATPEPPHENAFHMGAIIELGEAQTEAELQKDTSDPARILIAQLRLAGRIGDASDKEVVARVEADIEADAKREVSRAKAESQTNAVAAGELLAGLAQLIQKKAHATS